jgi:LPXTG-motif cell wall-anchored protein
MSTKHVTRLSVFAGIVIFTLAFFAGTSWATESKPCKEHPTTTTTEKPKATTTTTAKPVQNQCKITPKLCTTTTLKSGDNAHTTPTTRVAPKPVPSTTTTVEVATPEQIETPLYDSTPIVKSSTPNELAHTGAHTTFLALLGAALTGIGMVVLRVRNALAR